MYMYIISLIKRMNSYEKQQQTKHLLVATANYRVFFLQDPFIFIEYHYPNQNLKILSRWLHSYLYKKFKIYLYRF